MKKLLLNISERGKISHIPNRHQFIGRREPVTIQMVQAPLMQEPSAMVNIIISHNALRPCPTPNEFIPRVDTALKDRLDYIQKQLMKVQVERRQEEFGTFFYRSSISENLSPYIQLSKELYYDKDVSLGESAIPYHKQQRDLGSLNDRHPTNVHPHDTRKVFVIDESKPKKKMTYSSWSE